jgi:ribosomal protein L27
MTRRFGPVALHIGSVTFRQRGTLFNIYLQPKRGVSWTLLGVSGGWLTFRNNGRKMCLRTLGKRYRWC